jgi:poly-beta-1,6-N-acetyl-D-glucosamine biosynthesis protein PgaD
MRAERPIIVRPERQSWEQRLTSRTLSGMAWGIWLILWMPVISTLLWVFGARVTYVHIIRAPDETSLLLIFLIMFLCNMVVSSWSSYNYIRFARKARRRGAAVVSHEKVGALFGVTDPETLALLLHGRVLGLSFNESGGLIGVEDVNVDQKQAAEAESVAV